MTIAQIRSLILLGNLTAGGGLLFVGGGALWDMLLPPKDKKTLVIPKGKVSVKKSGIKEPRDRYRGIWRLPVVPDMQPREDGGPVEADTGPTGMTPEQAERLLDQAFELKMTSPNWHNKYRSFATVLLRQQNGEPQLIGVKDRVQGYRVTAILDDRVLFQVEDVQAPLLFKSGGANQFEQPGAGGSGPNPFAGRDNLPSGQQPFVAKAERVSDVEWHVSRQEAEWIEQNYHQVFREIDVRPHLAADGSIDGMELREVDPESLPAKRGFEGGDVIKSVNGEPVNNLNTLPQILAGQRGKKQLRIVYARKGLERTVTYKLP